MHNILITSNEFGSQLGSEHWRQLQDWLIQNNCRVIVNQTGRAMRSNDIIAVNGAQPLHGILVYSSSDEVNAEVIEQCSNLKVISRHGVGVENIAVKTAEQKGVIVQTTAGAKSEETVADLAFALMLAVARQVAAIDREMQKGCWLRPISADVWGKTLGIIGLGKIGKAVARRAKGFAMPVLAFDPFPDMNFVEETGITVCSKEQLLRQADFVSLHCTLTPETVNLIGERELELMKPEAFLINVARSRLVDQRALGKALASGRIRGAAVDVYDQEPPEQEYLLLNRPDNLVTTSHVGSYTADSLRRMDCLAVQNIIDAFKQAASAEAGDGQGAV